MIKKLAWSSFYQLSKFICEYFPFSLGPLLAKREYHAIMGGNLDLDNPKDLIEKIVWMQFHTDTTEWTRCADKLAVRNFVVERNCQEILIPLLGSWDKVEDIKLEKIEKPFILKANNSTGDVIIVKRDEDIKEPVIRKKLSKWIKDKYGYLNAQLHYLGIQPCIIAEKLLVDNTLENGEGLIDYKIWCFNGQPESILVVSDRKKGNYLLSFYDTEWNNISEKALNKNSKHYGNKYIKRPENLEAMLEYAKKLSKGFPQVRVDLYNIEGQIYFGELTFTSGYGTYSKEYYEYLGSKIDLSKVQKIR